MTRCCADKLSTDGVVVSKKTGTKTFNTVGKVFKESD